MVKIVSFVTYAFSQRNDLNIRDIEIVRVSLCGSVANLSKLFRPRPFVPVNSYYYDFLSFTFPPTSFIPEQDPGFLSNKVNFSDFTIGCHIFLLTNLIILYS